MSGLGSSLSRLKFIIIFMAKAITIYGQAFISENALVQDQILMTDKAQSENTVVIISDIWEDLKNPSGKWKAGKSGYFYWEVDMTNTEDIEKKVKVKISCPKPDPSLFDHNFNESEGDSEWTKYWKGKMKAVESSPYNSENGIQPKEITLPGTKYVNQNGDIVEVKETTITRDNLGDIQNLLLNLY